MDTQLGASAAQRPPMGDQATDPEHHECEDHDGDDVLGEGDAERADRRQQQHECEERQQRNEQRRPAATEHRSHHHRNHQQQGQRGVTSRSVDEEAAHHCDQADGRSARGRSRYRPEPLAPAHRKNALVPPAVTASVPDRPPRRAPDRFGWLPNVDDR